MSDPTPLRELRTVELIRRRNMNWRGPCEAGVSINDDFGKPLVKLCNEPGKWFTGGFAFGMVLCEEHEHLQDRVNDMAMHIRDLREKKKGNTSDG